MRLKYVAFLPITTRPRGSSGKCGLKSTCYSGEVSQRGQYPDEGLRVHPAVGQQRLPAPDPLLLRRVLRDHPGVRGRSGGAFLDVQAGVPPARIKTGTTDFRELLGSVGWW